jgi:hypothetical protein
MNGSAFLVGDSMERCFNVKYFGRVYNLTAVCDDGEKAENQAKAVEKRRRATKDIVRCKPHAVANES